MNQACRGLSALLRDTFTWTVFVTTMMVALGCQQGQRSPTIGSATREPNRAPAISSLASERDALSRAYRLKPDARFLIASSIVHAVLTGEPRTVSTSEFSDGKWHVRHGATEVGTLPELPGFADGSALLTRLSAALLKTHPLSGSPVATQAFEPLELNDALTTLEKLSRAWAGGERSIASVQQAANASVSVDLEAYDDMDMGDEIAGRALALVSILEAAGGDARSQKALLAKDLDYWGAGRTIATSLPPSAVRAFVLHDDDALSQLAKLPASSQATRVLFLRRLDVNYERDKEIQWIRAELPSAAYSLPALFARLAFAPDIITERSLSAAMPYFVFLAASQRAGDPRANAVAQALASGTDMRAFTGGAARIAASLGVDDETLLDAFESTLTKIAPGLQSPLFDAETERVFFRTLMYTALARGAHHTIFVWNSRPAAEASLARWGTAGGAPAADFRLWVRELIDAEWGRKATSELVSTMKDLPSFGGASQRSLYNQLSAHADYGDPKVVAGARVLVSRMDTRLADRRMLFEVAYEGLHDLAMAERIGRSILADSPPRYERAESSAAWLLRDGDWYKARLSDSLTTPGQAIPAAAALEALGLMQDSAVRAEARKRLASVPADWWTRASYTDYLFKKGAFDEARATAQDWLAHNERPLGLDPISATAVVARTFYRQHQYAEGFKVLQPVLSSQKGDVMALGASLLWELGRTDDAEALARQRLERYPYVQGLSQLAELYWSDGKYDDAAKLFSPPKAPTSWGDMRFVVGPGFVRAFEKKPQGEIINAFHAMSSVDPHLLRELAYEVATSGKKQLAFDLASPLGVPGMENLEFLILDFSYLKEAAGYAQAASWLRSRTPPPLLEPLCQFAFRDSQDELLWDLVPTPDPSRKDDAAEDIWQFRAASVVRGASESHRREVLDHYTQPVGGRYDVIGRYLLGMVGEGPMMALAVTPHDASEVAYWMGFRAEVDRRYLEANDWYRISDESGVSASFEYRQAHDKLQAWYSGGKALSLLASR